VIRRGLALALVALAAGFLAAGGRIYLKAQLAQVLLRRAWAETQATGRPVKPWSWADTWPVARLSVPRHDVDLIVLAGASGRTLAFGPGHLDGSAAPGTPGNTVVTGHRDTQFRFLKDLAPGDELGLVGPDGARHRYVVMDALVVDERDTSVLAETGEARLTLVTCFPFDALVPGGPLRYVVRAASPGFQRPLAARPPLPRRRPRTSCRRPP
jgi:sortase A